MKKKPILLIVLLSMGFAFNSLAQKELKVEINNVLPFLSIPETKLAQLNTLKDLDKRYPTSWVREYISVEITASKNGTQTTVSGLSDVLNPAQKELIRGADRRSAIAVTVRYLPENSLKKNTVKQYDFTVTILPAQNAIYSEGAMQWIQELQKKGLLKIEAEQFTGYDLTAIQFTITEQGHLRDIQVVLPSKDPKTDEMLMMALSKMPRWKPATFSDGLNVKQNFVLTIGNMENCMVNLLNIRPIE